MTKTFDLNCAPLDQYPVIKKLTKSDMTTSQLVLPRLSVEEHIVRNMPEPLRDRLKEGDGRANIWVVDDENRIQHYLTMVDRDHRYSIISWGHVRASRELRAGQEMRFGWMDQKLHFIVRHEDNDGSNDNQENMGNDENNDDQGRGKGIDENIDEPPTKKRRADNAEYKASKPAGESSNPVTMCAKP